MADPQWKYDKTWFPNDQVPDRYSAYKAPIQAAADKYGVPVDIMWGLMQKESGGRPDITGDDGHGQGLFQIDDRFHKPWLDSHQNGRDPSSAADYAANLLSAYHKQLGGGDDWRPTVAAYNAGVGGVRRAIRHGQDPDSATSGGDHVAKVMEYAKRFHPYLGIQDEPQVESVDVPEDANVAVRDFEPLPQPGEQPEAPEAPPADDVTASLRDSRGGNAPVASSGMGNTFEQGGGLGGGPLQTAFRLASQSAQGATGEAPALDTTKDVVEPSVQKLQDLGVDPNAPDLSTTANPTPVETPNLGDGSKMTMAQKAAALKDFLGDAPDPLEISDSLRGVKAPEQEPPIVETQKYETKPSVEAAPRDFLSEFRNARTQSDRLRALNDMRLGIDQISRAFTRTPADPEFAKRLDAEAQLPVQRVTEDMALDDKLRAQTKAQQLRDPASADSRQLQDFVIKNLPSLARRLGPEAIRAMSGEDLQEKLGLQAKFAPIADLERNREMNNFLGAQRAISNIEKINADSRNRYDANLVAGLKALGVTDRQDQQNLRLAVNVMQKRDAAAKQYEELVPHFERIDNILKNSGLPVGQAPVDITPGNFNRAVSKIAPGIDNWLNGLDPGSKQQAMDQLRREYQFVFQTVRHPITGANLTGHEAKEWEAIGGGGMLNDPAAQWLFLESVRDSTKRQLTSINTRAKNTMDLLAPGTYDKAMGAPGVISESSLSGGAPVSSPKPAARPQTAAPAQNSPQAAPVTPPPAQNTPTLPADAPPEAKAALKWALENPKDPRAPEILKRLGVMK